MNHPVCLFVCLTLFLLLNKWSTTNETAQLQYMTWGCPGGILGHFTHSSIFKFAWLYSLVNVINNFKKIRNLETLVLRSTTLLFAHYCKTTCPINSLFHALICSSSIYACTNCNLWKPKHIYASVHQKHALDIG